MDFTNTPLEWKNEGTEPTEEIKEKGFVAGYKPPAAYFNWFWSKVCKCIAELQTKLTGEESARILADEILEENIAEHTVQITTAIDHVDEKNNPHNVTKSQVGLGNVPNVTTNNQTPTFTEANTRSNVNSGETMSTILGKIKKWFSDMKTVAFTGSYNDLSNKPTSMIPTSHSSTSTTYGVGNSSSYGHLKLSDSTSSTSSISSGIAATPKAIKSAYDKAVKASKAQGATIVVGTTSSGHTAEDVDYLCDGTEDNTQIQSAVNAVMSSDGGGKILLLEGTYNISDVIWLNGGRGLVIEGMSQSGLSHDLDVGRGTIINLTGEHSFIRTNGGLNGTVTLRDLHFQGTTNSGIVYFNTNYSDILFDNCSCNIVTTGNEATAIASHPYTPLWSYSTSTGRMDAPTVRLSGNNNFYITVGNESNICSTCFRNVSVYGEDLILAENVEENNTGRQPSIFYNCVGTISKSSFFNTTCLCSQQSVNFNNCYINTAVFSAHSKNQGLISNNRIEITDEKKGYYTDFWIRAAILSNNIIKKNNSNRKMYIYGLNITGNVIQNQVANDLEIVGLNNIFANNLLKYAPEIGSTVTNTNNKYSSTLNITLGG